MGLRQKFTRFFYKFIEEIIQFYISPSFFNFPWRLVFLFAFFISIFFLHWRLLIITFFSGGLFFFFISLFLKINGSSVKAREIILEDQVLISLKKILISNDLGLAITTSVINHIEDKYKNMEKKSISLNLLKEEVSEFLEKKIKTKIEFIHRVGVKTPEVIVLLGNNGVGKTNLAVKLAYFLGKNFNKKVLVTSLDFFRAGAKEQLSELVKKYKNENLDYLDSSSKNVKGHTYDSYMYGVKNNYDILILDTSGRIHTHEGLMEEVGHINKILIDLKANLRNILVVDKNFGSMAISSYEAFNKVVSISGIIVTKVDSNSGGGWLIKLGEQYGDVKIFGQVQGEGLEDFKDFDSNKFCKSIVNWEGLNE